MKIFLRLLSPLLPLCGLVALAVLLGGITIASNMGLLSLSAYLIAASALAPLLITLTLPIYIVRVLGVSRALSRYAERLISHSVAFRLLARLRTQVYVRLSRLSTGQLLTYRSGDVLARLVGDVEEVQHLYLRLLSPFLVWLLICALTYALFAIFDRTLALLALAFLVLTGIGVPLLSWLLTRRLGGQQMSAQGELKAQMVAGIQGMADLLTCNAEERQTEAIMRTNAVLTHVQHHMATVNGLQQALHDGLMKLALWVLLLIAITLVTAKAITGVYLAFLTLLILASFEAIQPLGQALQLLGHSLAAGKRIYEVIDTVPEVREQAIPIELAENATSLAHTLEFENVRFSYPSQQENALQDISFSLLPGQKIAVVGPSGAGKSTLARLALRDWDTSAGSIRLDGQDIRNYRLEDLRFLFSVVDQETYLFNDTLRNNLLLARPGSSEEQVQQAIEQAGLGEFLARLPAGLDTWIGEQGQRLSGGERQRVAIARALLKDAPLLILDEATANLDPLTEQELLTTLAEVTRERTLLLITHRLVELEEIDEILVLDGGRICQRGTHEKLCTQEGLYRTLLNIQNEQLVFI